MQSFYNRFLTSAQAFPSHVAVELQLAQPQTGVEAYTFSQLRTMAESIGRWLSESGVSPRERCAILAGNSPRWAAAYLGVLSAGAVAVPLDTAFKPDQVTKLLLDSGSSLLFTDVEHLEVAQKSVELAGGKTKIALLNASAGANSLPSLDQMFAAGPGEFKPPQSAADDLAVILYTSGTTSDPKGVMLTHTNLDAEANAIFSFIRIDQRDAILGVLPLFHALAQMANLLVPFTSGARVVYLEQLNTGELIRALRERQITLFCCVPQFFYLIHDKVMKQVAERSGLQQFAFRMLMRLARMGRALGINLGRLFFAKAHKTLGTHIRYLITGGSRFDTQIGKDLETLGFDIVQAYGLTECSGGATVSGIGERFIGSVGRALPTVQVRVVDAGFAPDTSIPEGAQYGEVAIGGTIVMKGYYNRPDATAEVLKDGWLLSGDLGYLDSRSNLFITGRKKDVIVLSSGKNIYPEEIEAHYLATPWIKEICVMGLQSKPGEPFNERIHAVIVPNFEVMREKKIVNMKEVLRYDIEGLSAQLPAGKRILSYDIWQDDLPRTTTRKLKRYEIMKMVQQRAAAGADDSDKKPFSADDDKWFKDPVVERSMEVIRPAAKHANQIHPSDNLELDLGLDSMERVELVVALEHALGAQADPALISEVYTVRELVEAVRKGIGATGARLKAGWEEVFKTESIDPEVLAILEPRSIAVRLWFVFGRLVALFCRIAFRLEISGLEKLPKSGPFILSPNHQSYLDAPILVSYFPFKLYRELFYVGTSEIFGSGPMKRLAKSLKLIPVDPDANLVPAMRAGAFGLSHGKVLVLYPEGERSIDGTPKMFKKGAAILALHHNVPIYPVGLEGFHDAWPRGRNFRGFHKLRISIGDPVVPPQNVTDPDSVHDSMTDELKSRVMDLWKPLHEKNVG